MSYQNRRKLLGQANVFFFKKEKGKLTDDRRLEEERTLCKEEVTFHIRCQYSKTSRLCSVFGFTPTSACGARLDFMHLILSIL